MKTVLNLKRFCLIGMLGLAMTGCLDSDDPEFGFNYAYYVIQKNTENPDGSVSKEFAPYVGIRSTKEEIAEASVRYDNMPLFSFKKLSAYVYETVLRPVYYNTAIPNGEYVINAASANGETASAAFTLNVDQSMGAMKISDFEYKEGSVIANWEKVENAQSYYLLIGFPEQVEMIKSYYRVNSVYSNWSTLNNANGKLEGRINLTTVSSAIKPGDELIIALVAVYAKDQLNKVYLESDYYKIIVGQDGMTPTEGFGY